MTKIDIFSGFLGAGKTTLIKKLLSEAYNGEKTVLIENEFGEIGIDGGFLKEAGVEITEMNSGCICCSLVGDFSEALKKVLEQFEPDRILIEPSGVGKLSDVTKAVCDVVSDKLMLNSSTVVVDAKKCKMYMKNFGEFYNNQIEHAACIVLSHTTGMSDEKINECVKMLREKNADAEIVTTPWEELDGKKILNAMEKTNTLQSEIERMTEEQQTCPVCGEHHHEHHHHDHDEECCCHGHQYEHEHDEECCCHDHHHDHEHKHHHEHDEECCCHDHHHEHEHHHHEHDEDCCCHEHHHDHGHHHADEVFTSWGKETTHKYTVDKIKSILDEIQNDEKYGMVLRAKGIVASEDGGWIHFDYVPGEPDVRTGVAETIGRLCVIGSKIDNDALENLFSVTE